MTKKTTEATERGFTLIELMIAGVLFLAVLGVTYSSILAVTKANSQNAAKLNQEAGYRRVMNRIAQELQQSSTQLDPKTNLPRYRMWDGESTPGTRTIQTKSGKTKVVKIKKTKSGKTVSVSGGFAFQMVEGASTANGEVQPTWSTEVSYTVENGNVIRTKDGVRSTIGSGFDSISLEATSMGRFKLTCVNWLNSKGPGALKAKTITREKTIKPWN